MEIEVFKVYELNEYGKGILQTDKIFVAEKLDSQTEGDFYIVVHKYEGKSLEYGNFELKFIQQIIK